MTLESTLRIDFLAPHSFRGRARFLDGRFEIGTMLSLGSGYKARGGSFQLSGYRQVLTCLEYEQIVSMFAMHL